MSKRGVAVLVCTFLALVAATVWVPVVPRITLSLSPGPQAWGLRDPAIMWLPAPSVEWERIDLVMQGHDPSAVYRDGMWVAPPPIAGGLYKKGAAELRWGALALTHSVLVAIGGLLALLLRTRAARGAA